MCEAASVPLPTGQRRRCGFCIPAEGRGGMVALGEVWEHPEGANQLESNSGGRNPDPSKKTTEKKHLKKQNYIVEVRKSQ